MEMKESSKSKFRKLFSFKNIGVAGLFLAALFSMAHYVWKFSGNGQWSLESEKDGVSVFSMKMPGRTLKKFRTVARMPGTLDGSVAMMMDTSVATCSELVPGCISGKAIKKWNADSLSSTYLWRVDLPSPMTPREFLLETKFIPNLRQNKVVVMITAFPNLAPKNDCCHRVAKVRNVWSFTEISPGLIEVVSIQDMDAGLPYFLLNSTAPMTMQKLFKRLPGIINKKEFQVKKYEFMQGGDATPNSKSAVSG
ncbi:MAG: hypothetical protein E6Q34_02370 [Burkholderiaceae bacterium]|nr:MAG: hypothetical protein E6Q34_02370 [Burkholderiaceae bacterium]